MTSRAAELSQLLADRMDQLVVDLLPGGHREGREWRAGSVAGEQGASLRVHLAGDKRGHWCDFATGQHGDALDLVREALGLDTAGAMVWARRWLGLDHGEAVIPSRPLSTLTEDRPKDPNRWQAVWAKSTPIANTLAETYLGARGLIFADPAGDVMRFAARRARKNPDGLLEHHPALLVALRDLRTGQQVGVTNIYLCDDGADRLRDTKGKTVTGRATGAAMMLSAFDEPTQGLTVCEGPETGVALMQAGLAPVWAVGGAGFLKTFPALGGIECLTIAADADEPGQTAALEVVARWRAAGKEVITVAPPVGDWADPRRPV